LRLLIFKLPVGRLVSFVGSTVCRLRHTRTPVRSSNYLLCPMADHSLANTARTTDSSQASEIERPSSTSALGLATRTLSFETSATAMARLSLDLRDLEAASASGALDVVPETQWPSTEAIMHELSTDSEVTFRRVLGSAEILPTRPTQRQRSAMLKKTRTGFIDQCI